LSRGDEQIRQIELPLQILQQPQDHDLTDTSSAEVARRDQQPRLDAMAGRSRPALLPPESWWEALSSSAAGRSRATLDRVRNAVPERRADATTVGNGAKTQ